jgi:glycerophosphoryl diester phosphodiesterase
VAPVIKSARTFLIAAAALASVATPAAGAFEIHAHRGGTLGAGHAVGYENSLSLFKGAVAISGADVVELDVHVSKDDVPFVMHDATLDRTTDCTGLVTEHTAAELDACNIDLLGSGDQTAVIEGAEHPPVPRLAAVLAWAGSTRTPLNVEINHYPTEPDYDAKPNFAATELDALDASGIPKRRLLIQSFLPSNLDPARARGYRTALITFDFAEANALEAAKAGGYDVLEPQWPLKSPKQFVKEAHAAGKRVIPFTVNTRAGVRDAIRAGADGVITDDPIVARVALRCETAGRRLAAATRRLDAARAAARRAQGPRTARRLEAAQRAHAAAARHRKRACASLDQ